MKTRKVITSARLRNSEPATVLNIDSKSRAVIIGKKAASTANAVGLIGKVAEQSTTTSLLDHGVWLDLVFPHVIGIFGTRGSGKSFDLGVLVECIAGTPSVVDGVPPHSAVILFDVQDQFWTLGLAPDPALTEDAAQISQLEAWGLTASALPVKTWSPAGTQTPVKSASALTVSPAQLTSDDWLAALELERYSPMGQALLTILKTFGSLPPSDLATRAIASPVLTSFQSATIDGLKWRLESLAETKLIADPGVSAESFLTPGQVSIVLLRQLGESLRALLVGVLARIVGERMSRHHYERRVARRTGQTTTSAPLPDRLCLVMDEAHVIVPNDRRTPATDPIVDYVKRGRDAGLSLIFATQQPSAVDSRLMSQVDLTLTHSLGFESDLQAAIARMPTRGSSSYELASWKLHSTTDVLRALDPGECIVADAANGRTFVARIRPRVTAHGGNTPA